MLSPFIAEGQHLGGGAIDDHVEAVDQLLGQKSIDRGIECLGREVGQLAADRAARERSG